MDYINRAQITDLCMFVMLLLVAVTLWAAHTHTHTQKGMNGILKHTWMRGNSNQEIIYSCDITAYSVVM